MYNNLRQLQVCSSMHGYSLWTVIDDIFEETSQFEYHRETSSSCLILEISNPRQRVPTRWQLRHGSTVGRNLLVRFLSIDEPCCSAVIFVNVRMVCALGVQVAQVWHKTRVWRMIYANTVWKSSSYDRSIERTAYCVTVSMSKSAVYPITVPYHTVNWSWSSAMHASLFCPFSPTEQCRVSQSLI
jgi:hypothetical protein